MKLVIGRHSASLVSTAAAVTFVATIAMIAPALSSASHPYGTDGIVGASSSPKSKGATAKSKAEGATSKRCARPKHGRQPQRKCRRHDERKLRTIDATKSSKVAPSAPRQGKDPDLLAPWEPGVTLISGGACGDVAGKGAHRDYNGKWIDDRFAIDFGVCGSADFGVRVVAAHSGFVKEALFDADYGWTVVIERSLNRLATRYAHLAKRPDVGLGDHVRGGEVIGRIGYSGLGGFKRQAHLHFVAYRSRGKHAGQRIGSIAGLKPCDDCRIESTSDAPPGLDLIFQPPAPPVLLPAPPAPPPPPPPPPPAPPPPLVQTRLVSVATGVPGIAANSDSTSPAISGDGAYVTFESVASNLDPADGDTDPDVFMRDVQSGTATLVSRASGDSGPKGNGFSTRPAISSDGRYVTFESTASNLDPAAIDGNSDVFVRNLQTHTTTLVSRATGDSGTQGNGESTRPAISGDGRYVAFLSSASNLVATDSDGTIDVFVRDLLTRRTTLVSRASGDSGAKSNGASFSPAISSDGRYVTFESTASNLDAADIDGNFDVFVRDLQTGTTTLVSRANGHSGPKGNADSRKPAISSDGRYVTFESTASNLDPVDRDSVVDVFVRDLEATATTIVSRAPGHSGTKGNDHSFNPAISSDGRYVTFESYASNFGQGEVSASVNVFVRDRQPGTTTLVSRANGTDGPTSNGSSTNPALSTDGRHVAFVSAASNFDSADGDTTEDVFVRDLDAETTTLASRATGTTGVKGRSFGAAVSNDGRYVVFASLVSRLDSADSDTLTDVFVRDLHSGTTALVSRATGDSGAKGNGSSASPAISSGGRYVTFVSSASNLHPADRDATDDVFVRDLQAGTTTLVSRATGNSGAKGNGSSSSPAVSGDGRYVTFASCASNLDPADNKTPGDVFRELKAWSSQARSDDGSDVGCNSNPDPGDGADLHDVFVRDLQTGTTTLVSRETGGSGTKADGTSSSPAISSDGRYVVFVSTASNLDRVASQGPPTRHGEVPDFYDVFVRDLQTATTVLVSRSTSGTRANNTSGSATISADGRYVTFGSHASNLDPADRDTRGDVFARDRQTGTTTLVSRATGGAGIKENGEGVMPTISADGRYVAFTSVASNLDPADVDTTEDVFLRDLQVGTTQLISRATGDSGAKGNRSSSSAAISGDGRYVAFGSTASNLDPADDDMLGDVFLRGVLRTP
jgi:Tol biopolymer transport system component